MNGQLAYDDSCKREFKESAMKDSAGYFYGLAAVFIWTGFILVSRMGGISELSAYDVIAVRYITCAGILLPIWLFVYPFRLFKPKLIMTALVGGLAYALFTFKGFQLAPS